LNVSLSSRNHWEEVSRTRTGENRLELLDYPRKRKKEKKVALLHSGRINKKCTTTGEGVTLKLFANEQSESHGTSECLLGDRKGRKGTKLLF